MSNGLVFRISSIPEILETQSGFQYPSSVSHSDHPNDTIITLPIYRIATLLLQSFESTVDHLCRILHVPTVRSFMKSFYLRLNQNEAVSSDEAALLLSIFAIAAYFYQPFDNSEVATSRKDGVHLSKFLSKGALDVLDYSRRNTSGTLGDVQASIFMSFVTYHLDGFSARGRFLSTAAASIARELRLHRLDAEIETSTVENESSVRCLIDREVKRRVFWYIASTDWWATISYPKFTHC